MHRNDARILLVVAVLALAGLAGCSDSDEFTQPTAADTQADVAAGSSAAAVAGPESDTAGSLVVGMMNLLEPAQAPPAAGGVAAAFVPPACPAQFDLGNGIVGECQVSGGDVVTFVFYGIVSADGVDVSVNGTLVATPTVEQPQTGSRYAIDFDATASSVRGEATWSVTGTVVVDDLGEVMTFSLTMTHTVTPTGGPTSMVTVVIGPDRFELVATGPRGNVVRFILDRNSMSGVVTVNGFQVAVVAFADGCAAVDFLNPELVDRTICPGN